MVTERGMGQDVSGSKGNRPLQDVIARQSASGAYSTPTGQESRDSGHLPQHERRHDGAETPGNGATGNMDAMAASDETGDVTGDTPGLDSVRELRLMALLHDLVRGANQATVADELGVDRKTLWRSMHSGRLAPVLALALERRLLADARAELVGRGQRLDALERRVGALEEALSTGLGAIHREVAELREAQAPAARPRDERTPPGRPAGTAREQRPGTGAVARPPWRPYSQLVTSEPEPGEELVYGEATANVVAWREARRMARENRGGLERLDAELRMRELELVLIGEHELTLPPATYPWDRADRRSQVWRRRQALADVSAERRRALALHRLRRLLTFGLWRK